MIIINNLILRKFETKNPTFRAYLLSKVIKGSEKACENLKVEKQLANFQKVSLKLEENWYLANRM